jgi:hypothetical protein
MSAISKWLRVHRSAILGTIVVLQNSPLLGEKVKGILGSISFLLGAT